MEFGLNGLDNNADFFGGGRYARGGGEFGDGFGHQGVEAGFVEGFGQEFLDDDDLGGFSSGQLGAVAPSACLPWRRLSG